ncbi:MAG: DUF4112 domain-containing protein [Alphaproteobacteria bacterium]
MSTRSEEAEPLRGGQRGTVTPEELARAEWLGRLLDDRFRIPGTGIRFGLDAVIGLIPGVGDWLTFLLSLYPVHVAWKAGVPLGALARMILNVLLDAGIGTIPVVGDLFDLFWKGNRRNLDILARHRKMKWD